ncbi:MAG: mechanosensitive ion channel family protein [Chloroflexi bacterium]|nr:mechanosensitive ion channel family protein [Chloroflexota bacterium]
MDDFNISALTTVDALIVAIILAAGATVAWVLRRLLRRLEKHARDNTAMVLDDYLIGALGDPLFVGVVLLSLYIGSVYLTLNPSIDGAMRQALLVGLAATGIYAVLAVVDAFLRWYCREIAKTTHTSLDDKLIPILRVSIPIIGGLPGLLGILRILGVEHAGINDWLAQHGIRLAAITALTLVAFFSTSYGLPRLIKTMARRGMGGQPDEEVKKRSETLAVVLVTTSQVITIGVGVIMLLSEFADIAPILAGVGVAGIAIGFGAQSLVKDVLNGLLIIMEGHYHVGDVVRIADIGGLVEGMNLRRTVLRDLDGIVHFVPNGEIRVASNFTKEYSRVNLNISVAYDTNLDHAIAVLNRVGKALAEDPAWQPFILKPPQVLRVDKLGDSGIDIKVVGDTRPIKQWDVMGELRKRAKEAFDREGIEIPWPHTKVYFGDSPLLARYRRDRGGDGGTGEEFRVKQNPAR